MARGRKKTTKFGKVVKFLKKLGSTVVAAFTGMVGKVVTKKVTTKITKKGK